MISALREEERQRAEIFRSKTQNRLHRTDSSGSGGSDGPHHVE